MVMRAAHGGDAQGGTQQPGKVGRLANEADVEEYKLLITSGQPVVISVYCTEYTKHAGGDGYWCEYGVIPEKSKTHAMCVVGYDDPPKCMGKAWVSEGDELDKGNSRGDGGFLWIAYDLVREKGLKNPTQCTV